MLTFITILASVLVSSVAASPVAHVAVDDVREAEDSSPDLLSMLESFKGTNPMETLSNFMTEYKVIKNAFKKVALMSPLYKNIFDETAKENPEFRLLMKLAEGQSPDLHDIYDLSKQRKKGFSLDLSTNYKASLKYEKLMALLHQPNSILDSTQDVQTFFDIFSGTHVNFNPNLVAEIRKKIYKPSAANVEESNALILISIFQSNFHKLIAVTQGLAEGSTTYTDLLKHALDLDYTALSHVKAIQPKLDGNKYSVTSSQTLVTDPDALQILQDKAKADELMKQASPDQAKAEMLISDMLNRAVNMTYRVLQAVKASSGINSRNEKPSMG